MTSSNRSHASLAHLSEPHSTIHEEAPLDDVLTDVSNGTMPRGTEASSARAEAGLPALQPRPAGRAGVTASDVQMPRIHMAGLALGYRP